VSVLRDNTDLLAKGVVRRAHGASGVSELDSPSSAAHDCQFTPNGVPFANRPLVGHRLWLVRAALAPAKRITRAAWPDLPGRRRRLGPSPCGFGGPRDS